MKATDVPRKPVGKTRFGSSTSVSVLLDLAAELIMADNVQPTQDQLKYGAQHTQCRHRRVCGVLDIFVRQRFSATRRNAIWATIT